MKHPPYGKIMGDKTTLLQRPVVPNQQIGVPTFSGYLAKRLQPFGKPTGIIYVPHTNYDFAFMIVFHLQLLTKKNITIHSSGLSPLTFALSLRLQIIPRPTYRFFMPKATY